MDSIDRENDFPMVANEGKALTCPSHRPNFEGREGLAAFSLFFFPTDMFCAIPALHFDALAVVKK